MSIFTERWRNLLEYVGIQSQSRFHAASPVSYDPKNPLPYYLDFSARADYPGPVDANGVPMYPRHGQATYLPAAIALTALGQLSHSLKNSRAVGGQQTFLKLTDWFVESQDASGLWLNTIIERQYGLTEPWPSAMSQGLAISCLVRAGLLTNDTRYIQSATKALIPFGKQVDCGGVVRILPPHFGGKQDMELTFYEEYPSRIGYHVLNGFIYALFGLYDLWRVVDNAQAKERFESGLFTLKQILHRFDTGYWSKYHISDKLENPATVPYHRLHIQQLFALHRITGDSIFEEFAIRWEGYSKGRFNALRTLPAKVLWRLTHPM